MNKIKPIIILCSHKEEKLPQNKNFIYYYAGKEIGINISNKNSSYSELTGLYWFWKNHQNINKECTHIGINHYRRYFAIDKSRSLKNTFTLPEDKISKYSFDEKQLQKLLVNNDGIVAKKIHFPYSLATQYCNNHYSDDYILLKDTVKKYSPEYYDEFVNTMEFSNKLIPYNMFILKKEIVFDYCKWIFFLLETIENKKKLDSYSSYQKRIYGFYSERLLNVFINKHKLKVKEIPIYQYINNEKKDWNTKQVIAHNFRCDLSFFISTGYRK